MVTAIELAGVWNRCSSIDNHDSFTYNLVSIWASWEEFVFRNDQISTGEIEEMQPKRIVISPGPARRRRLGSR
jgi:anthranilate synthase component 2